MRGLKERGVAAVASPSPGGYLDGDSQRLLAPLLVRDITEGTHFRAGPDGGLYRLDDGVYRDDGDEVVRFRVQELLKNAYQVNRAETAVELIATRERVDPLDFDPPAGLIIHAANGIVHLDPHPSSPFEIEKYTRENAWFAQSPWSYDPDAPEPTKILNFLRTLFPGDDSLLTYVLALIGYGMIPRNVLRRSILFHGNGNNGKSILLHIIGKLYGSENVSTVSLDQLTSGRFMSAELRGKSANICGDIGPQVGDAALFNQMTGGDPIAAERKFGHPFSYKTGAVPIFSSNVFPRASDPTPAFIARWSVVPFTVQFEENAGMEKTLLALADDPDEMAGLFNLAIKWAAWLTHHQAPTTDAVPEAMRDAKLRFWKSADSAKSFMEEACEKSAGDGYRETLGDLYTHYERYCKSSGAHPLAKNNFATRVEREKGVETIKPKNVKTYVGIRVRKDWSAESDAQFTAELRAASERSAAH